MLKAICAGFEETTEPAVCLTHGEQLLLFINRFRHILVDMYIFVLDILA